MVAAQTNFLKTVELGNTFAQLEHDRVRAVDPLEF